MRPTVLKQPRRPAELTPVVRQRIGQVGLVLAPAPVQDRVPGDLQARVDAEDAAEGIGWNGRTGHA